MKSFFRLLIPILALALLIGGSLWWKSRWEIDRIIITTAKEYNLDPRLLSAVAWKETRYDPTAIGTSGEIGMFQVMPATAGNWAKDFHEAGKITNDELADLATNARIAAWYLRAGLDLYADRKRPQVYALARYNAGHGKVRAWSKGLETDADFYPLIAYPTTRRYVKDILQRAGTPLPADLTGDE